LARPGFQRSLLGNRDGSGAIEFAVIMPVFLAGVLGIMEVGRALWTQNTLQRAVEAAARCASIDAANCGSSTATKNYAVTQAFDLNVTSNIFTVTAPACGNQVAASYPFVPVSAIIDLPRVTLTARACFPK
jgi:Flp pilus assembly protein TadG